MYTRSAERSDASLKGTAEPCHDPRASSQKGGAFLLLAAARGGAGVSPDVFPWTLNVSADRANAGTRMYRLVEAPGMAA